MTRRLLYIIGLTHLLCNGWAKDLRGKALPPWKKSVDQASESHQEQLQTLQMIMAKLKAACVHENWPDCTRLIPPETHLTGYGLLPKIVEDGPHRTQEPKTTRYALAWLHAQFRDVENAQASLVRAMEKQGPQAQHIAFYLKLEERLDRLDAHVKYHEHWQQAAEEYSAWYRGRAPLARRARAIMQAIRDGEDSGVVSEMRSSLVQDLARLRPVEAGLQCRCELGLCLLVMRVYSDIQDLNFLETFKTAVDTHFSGKVADQVFKVTVDITSLDPHMLYPEGPPKTGAEIDLKAHLSRFPSDAFVLTTGAASTHAFIGRSVVVSNRPISPRELAHEAGHLLGFQDVYLRHAVPSDDPTQGHVFTEFSGLQPNLMGDSYGGRVTQNMRRRFLRMNCGFN